MKRANSRSWTFWINGVLLTLLVGAVGLRVGLSTGYLTMGDERSGNEGLDLSRVRVQPAAFVLQGQRPSLEGGIAWLNTAGPIRLEELRGKIVLLDFWTYCCINCHHILPDLAKLEEKYKNELVVIGVHSPKFFAERDTENIRRKIREYGIKHPVVNDADQVLWNRFGVNSWPTLVLIDPKGDYQGALPGEGHYPVLDKAIGNLVSKHRAKGDLNESPFKFFPENEKPDDTPLLFPGKVLVDAASKRLFIADTAHHRIVMTDTQGKGARPIGTGLPGLVDGTFDKAGFNRPQGMCLLGETLYVADTENHAIRAVDLKARTVGTVAGNGQQSRRHERPGLSSDPARTASLNSPWDVVLVPNTRSLLIAMAGWHQIWRLDLDSGVVGAWAGTGDENIRDGLLNTAEFAQPSGLATDGTYLYVADSEVSGIRSVTLDKRNHRVQTIVGNGLFMFGDVDGVGGEVRLQHCLGVAYGNDKLYIADTYNNKIKVCDPRSRTVETLIGARQMGESDNPPLFYQPGGISFGAGNLYVADTNNHKIRVVDLKEKTVKTLELTGLTPPAPQPRVPSFPNVQTFNLAAVQLAPGESLTLAVTVPLEAGFKVNPDVPMPYLVETPGKSGLLSSELPPTGGKVDKPSPRFSVKVPLTRPAASGDQFDLRFSLSTFVCNDKSSLCTVRSFVWNVPVTIADGGSSELTLSGKASRRPSAESAAPRAGE
jgi:DNA-binding beta-propeller fold protein YncE